MSMKYLAVDSDIELAESESAVWVELRGVGMDRVDTMSEAIQMLISKPSNEYLYVGINSDAVDCIPLLSAMREITDTPILLATNDFTCDKEAAAIASGADFYGRYHKTTEGNISSVLTWVEHATRKTRRKQTSRTVMFYKNLLVVTFLFQKGVFITNKNIELTRQEFDILNFLMENRGRVLTYKQIYGRVWGGEYEDSERDVLWSAIKRLREKLKVDPDNFEYIETVRDTGYCFPTGDGK